MKKYAKVIMGKDAREQKLYKSGLYTITRSEVEYDDGWWLIPFEGYPEWFKNLADLQNHISEYDP